jgi:ABC-type spermidine/putrescine transport system permease subunit II
MLSSSDLGVEMKAFQNQGYYFRYAAIATLITGMYLHVTSLFIGRDLLQQYILTPAFDMLLAIPMTYAGIVGWISWKQVFFNRGGEKFFYGFILVYFTISIPIHVQTFLTQSTDYINAFPNWYSYPILALMTLMLIFVWNLQYRSHSSAE